MFEVVPRPNLQDFDKFTQDYVKRNVNPLVLIDPPVDTFNAAKSGRSRGSGGLHGVETPKFVQN